MTRKSGGKSPSYTKTTFTQTYSTADTTVAAPTAVAPTIAEALTGVDTGTDMTAAQAAGLVADIAALETEVNALIADNLNLRKVATQLIDILQAANLAD